MPLAKVTEEDNIKLLAAFCILGNNLEKIATYMGLSKNAVQIRYAKLIKKEKAKIAAAGLLTDDMAATRVTKKRRATDPADAGAGKKVKVEDTGDERTDGDEGPPHYNGQDVENERDDMVV